MASTAGCFPRRCLLPDDSCQVAIIDHSLGNLYSVKHACSAVGLRAEITSDRKRIMGARAIILPGVGAFGDAMRTLERLDLVSALKDFAASGRPLFGICLGMQLLMTESQEFGAHRGLDLIQGDVVRFDNPREGDRVLKIPQIGWNGIWPPKLDGGAERSWSDSLLSGVPAGDRMYFVHSYVVRPTDEAVQLSTTNYGGITFCSALQSSNVVACQFHPERSGHEGLKVYRNLAALLHAKESHDGVVA